MLKKKRSISPEHLAAMKAGRERAKAEAEAKQTEADRAKQHAERVAAAERLLSKIKGPEKDDDENLFRHRRKHRRYHKPK